MADASIVGGDSISENAELLALQRIDETCVSLQQQGRYLEALECMERGLVLRQHFFGAESDEVWRACKTVGEMCNLLAMTYLQQEDYAMVLELLKKAEILTERDQAGRAVTFNNMACYYRRQGKLHSALTYLQKALKIEARLERVDNPADTHLNMCAVLSQLCRHAGALEHAQSALILLQEELFTGPGAVGASSGGAPVSHKVDRIAVLGIAYHNIGVEQEFLKRYEQSMHSYRKGVEIAETHLGNEHGITITLRNSLIAAKRAMNTHRASKRGGKKRHGGHKGGRRHGGHGGSRRRASPGQRSGKAASRHAAGARVSPTRAEEQRWESISSAYGDIPGVTPVRADEPKSQSMEPRAVVDEELPSAMAAAQHGITVSSQEPVQDMSESVADDAGGKLADLESSSGVGGSGESKVGGTLDLDQLVGAGADEQLEMMISPRPERTADADDGGDLEDVNAGSKDQDVPPTDEGKMGAPEEAKGGDE